MCQPKPGPRCAAHLRKEIARVKATQAENAAAFAAPAGWGAIAPRPTGELLRLEDEWDETRTGQNELAETLRILTEDGTHPHDLRIIRNRMIAAQQRRDAKLAALKSVQAGRKVEAAMQLRYGAHAGWLAHSPSMVTALKNGEAEMHEGYAVAYGDSESDTAYDNPDDQYGAYVTRWDVTVETPVHPGPTPGSHVAGDSTKGVSGVGLHWDGDEPPFEADPYTGGGHTRFARWNPQTRTLGTDPVTLTDLDVAGPPGHYDGDDSDRPVAYTTVWNKPTVVRDSTGAPVLLRFTGVTETALDLRYADFSLRRAGV